MRQCEGQKAAAKPTDNSGNRAIVFLVETSDSKAPDAAALGGGRKPLEKGAAPTATSGHVARNARLALAAVDVAQPYVCFAAVAAAVPPTTTIPQPPAATVAATAAADGGNATHRAAASAGAGTTGASGKHTLTLRWYVAKACAWKRFDGPLTHPASASVPPVLGLV